MLAVRLVAGTLVLTTTVAISYAALAQLSSGVSKSVGLKCPSENGGTLEHSEVDRSGMSYRQQLMYDKAGPTVLIAAEAKPGEQFRVHSTVDLRAESDDTEALFSSIVVGRLTTFLERACLGPPETRARFFEEIRANRASLGLP